MSRGGDQGDDAEVTLSEDGGVRYLHFGTEWIQGAMRIARPNAIEIDYVRNMMAWLLFLDPPPQILQLGLGAAALTKFCHRYLPSSATTVVELSAQVHRVARRWFALAPDDERLQVVIEDAMGYLQRVPRGRFGVVQVDLYDRLARGPVLDSLAFYRQCREAMAEPGILVVNLFGEQDSYPRNITRLWQVFDRRVLLLPPVPAGNVVALCFSGPPLRVERADLLARGERIQADYRLPATGWARALAAQIQPGDTALTI